MYQVGELVVYGVHGVCRIAAEERKMVDRKPVLYLVLEPLTQSGSRFLVPTHNTAAMSKLRHLMKDADFESLLSSESVFEDVWIPEESKRKQNYRERIASVDPVRLAEMVCTLYRHKAQQIAAGKKVHQSDDNFLRDGERLLAGEASVVFGWEMDRAKQYIRMKLKEEINSEC